MLQQSDIQAGREVRLTSMSNVKRAVLTGRTKITHRNVLRVQVKMLFWEKLVNGQDWVLYTWAPVNGPIEALPE